MLSHTLATSLLVALAGLSSARSLPQSELSTTNVQRRQAPMENGGADGPPNCQLGGTYKPASSDAQAFAVDAQAFTGNPLDKTVYQADISSCRIVACESNLMVQFCNDQTGQSQRETLRKIMEVATTIKDECSKPEKGGSEQSFNGQQFFGQRAWNVVVSGKDCQKEDSPGPDKPADPRDGSVPG